MGFGTGTWPGSVPLAGDWDGDGTDGIGFYAAGSWTLRNVATTPATTLGAFTFNPATSRYPVVGDWNADGIDRSASRTTPARPGTCATPTPGGRSPAPTS